MNADGSLRPTYYPRGLIVGTGEDTPNGYSCRARILILEMNPGDVDLDKLTAAQKLSSEGVFTQCLFEFIKWLTQKVNSDAYDFVKHKEEIRNDLLDIRSHSRTPDIIASLMMGLDVFLDFAVDMQALSAEQADDLAKEWINTLADVGDKQTVHLETEDPVRRFITLLAMAFSTGRAYLELTTGPHQDAENFGFTWIERGDDGYYESQGEHIGWLTKDGICLQPDAAYSLIQKLAREQNLPFPNGQKTIWKRLTESNIAVRSKDRNTVKMSIKGTRQNVILIPDLETIIEKTKTKERKLKSVNPSYTNRKKNEKAE